MADAERAQPFGMAGQAVAAGDEADHRRARGERAFDADRRILDDRDPADRHAERGGGVEIEIGRRLAARDMLAAGEDHVAERAVEAEMGEMAA